MKTLAFLAAICVSAAAAAYYGTSFCAGTRV
jgi:hypothetical protein